MQGDGLQTLYLMNPNYIGFSDNALPPQEQLQPPMFLNSGHALNSGGVSHARIPPSQHFVGVPLQASGQLQHDPNRSMWTALDQPQLPSAGGTADFTSQLGFHRSGHPQGLSLSLSPHQHQNQPFSSMPVESPVGLLSARLAPESHIRSPPPSAITGSRYLKAAQELLHEVANVEKIIKLDAGGVDGAAAGNRERGRMNKDSMSAFAGDLATELTTGQRQELQMKKAKLLSMLEEVELRDRQYTQQMQMTVASFEEAAGVGSAKSYTNLAMKTISRQFRCLKAAIGSQIKAAGRRLGEEETVVLGGGGSSSSSRLFKFGDQQLGHHQLQQHFGMMQPNAAWRPQRGLPERAVSVLRAWLFEHFLHPYPKDSDKIMLAKQTGLTRSQVSNWFINARVRLWKPMVEEMYTEEMKGQEKQGKEDNNKGTKRSEGHNPKEKPMADQNNSNNSPTADNISSNSLQPPQGAAFSFINNSADEILRSCGKKPRNDAHSSPRSSVVSVDMDDMKSPSSGGGYNSNRKFAGNFLDIQEAAAASTSGFGGFPIGDFGRPFSPENLAAPGFHGGNNNGSVSLTLALPPSENQQNYLSAHQEVELGRRMGIDNNDNNHQPPASHSAINGGYESIDFENAGKRFAAQLLPDFVA